MVCAVCNPENNSFITDNSLVFDDSTCIEIIKIREYEYRFVLLYE